MTALTKMCGLIVYPFVSLANEDHSKEYPLKKIRQFSGFRETSSQRSTTSPYIWNWWWVKRLSKLRRKQESKQVNEKVKVDFL